MVCHDLKNGSLRNCKTSRKFSPNGFETSSTFNQIKSFFTTYFPDQSPFTYTGLFLWCLTIETQPPQSRILGVYVVLGELTEKMPSVKRTYAVID